MSGNNECSKTAGGNIANGEAAGKRVLDIISLYPKDMNIYGDYGNVLTVLRRAKLYGYEPVVHSYNTGDKWPDRCDMILGGGGQDKGQSAITEDLHKRAEVLKKLASDGVPMLLICGMYQLFGRYFETVGGEKLSGIGVLDIHTTGQETRMIGNLVEHTDDFGDIVGYENHSGQTFLHDGGTVALGRVDNDGTGNNGEDFTEGARKNNVIGTYMHGSVLPKNPALADFLISTAAINRYGVFEPQQDSAQKAELDRLNVLARNAARVAVSRPR